MENEQEVRQVMLLLVQAVQHWQSAAQAANVVLSGVVESPPNRQAAILKQHLQEKTSQALANYASINRQIGMPVENALRSDEPFLELVKGYARVRLE